MECFVFGDKEGQEVIDTTSCYGRQNHENHIEVDRIRVDLEKKFKRKIDRDESKGYNSVTCQSSKDFFQINQLVFLDKAYFQENDDSLRKNGRSDIVLWCENIIEIQEAVEENIGSATKEVEGC